jgi:hypothetical protein
MANFDIYIIFAINFNATMDWNFCTLLAVTRNIKWKLCKIIYTLKGMGICGGMQYDMLYIIFYYYYYELQQFNE